MSGDDLCFVYMTVDDRAAAERISQALVTERLAACTNLIPGMTSYYQWKGQVERGEELVLIAKTRAALVPALTARVKALHPYEVPCIVKLALDSGAGNDTYLDWIRHETRDSGDA